MITSALRSFDVDPVTAGFFAVVVLTLAILALWKRSFALRSRRWPIIAAKIESVFVFASRRKYGEETHAVLGYSYSVGGDYYSGEIHLMAGGQHLSELEAKIVGKEVSIHFNPKKPEESIFLDDSVGDDSAGYWLAMDDPRTSLLSWFNRGD